MKKKLLSLALALALCAGLMAVPASAASSGKVAEPARIAKGGATFGGIVDLDGNLWIWGLDRANRPDSNSYYYYDEPTKIMKDIVSFSVSSDMSVCAVIKTDGSLWMWGENDHGQLGDGTVADSSEPVKVMDDVAAVSCGGDYTAALKTDGTLWTWGDNQFGQLGNRSQAQSLIPIKVMDDVAVVSCGGCATAAIKTDGSLWMCGANWYGILGNGGIGNAKNSRGEALQTVPVKVMDNVADVVSKSWTTFALKTDGSVWSWGYNADYERGTSIDGRLGIEKGNRDLNNGYGWFTNYQDKPVKVMDDVAAIGYCAAIGKDGTLWRWGSGNIGNGTSGSNTPVAVMRDVLAYAGDRGSIVVKTDGSVWTIDQEYTFNVEIVDPVTVVVGEYCVTANNSMKAFQRVSGAPTMLGVRLNLDGGMGTSLLWTKKNSTLTVPQNPTKKGYTFGGWYTDEALTKLYNFNDKVTKGFTLYARWVPITTVSETTGQSLTTITLNGNPVSVQTSVLLDANGNGANYVKLRDIAALLDGTGAQFNVDYRNGAIYVDSGRAYTTRNGTELKPIQGCDGSYMWNVNPVLFDGVTAPLEGIVLTDGDGGGHTFFKLRDLAAALDFTVEWTPEQGVTIKTN